MYCDGSMDCSMPICVTVGESKDVDYPDGFPNDPCDLVNNGSASFINGAARLTSGQVSQAGTIFTVQPVDTRGFDTTRRFDTTFTLQFTDGTTPPADGMAFVLQNNSPTIVGAAGGGLGYQGIPNSVAIKFDIFNNAGEGNNSTGIFFGGDPPDVPHQPGEQSIDLSPSGITLTSGHPMLVELTYDGTTLTENITDTMTGASFTHAYTVNLLNFLHAETAYAGFSGGTGGLDVTAQVLNWTYTPASGLPPLPPTGLAVRTAVADSGTTSSVTINWVSNSFDETGFLVQRSSDGANYVTVATVSPGTTSYTDVSLGAGTYYYRVRAFNDNGNSGYTNVDSVIVGTPGQPATGVDHGTGFSSASDLTGNGSATFAGRLGRFAANQDVGTAGDPGRAGSVTFASGTGTYTLTASGSDVWDNADHFQYAYAPLAGDGEIIARMAGATTADFWTKAGLMFRADLTAGSANAFMFEAPDPAHEEPVQQWRDTAGGASADTGNHMNHIQGAPVWLRLNRTGNVFTGYWAVDNGGGTHGPWQQMAAHTTAMPATVYVGLALTAHNNAQLATATFDNVTVTGTVPLTVLRLTDGGGGEAGSAFTTSRVGVANFSTTFTFRFYGGSNPSADGMCFVLQGATPTALGGAGGGLGYGPDNPAGPPGISNSIAVKFDLYDNHGEGPNSTGLFLNGDSPTIPVNPGDVLVNLNNTGIDLHSQHVFQVTLSYDGTTLTETITDTSTQATFTTSYIVDIVGQVGGDVGYAGFTAGTGGLTTIADVIAWSYSFTEPPSGPAPRGGQTGGGLGSASLAGALGTLPGSLGSGSGTTGPAVFGRASPGANQGRGLADLLFRTHTGSGPDPWEGLPLHLTTGPRRDLGKDLLSVADGVGALDSNAVDVLFSRL
jgi:hypothetical protein